MCSFLVLSAVIIKLFYKYYPINSKIMEIYLSNILFNSLYFIFNEINNLSVMWKWASHLTETATARFRWFLFNGEACSLCFPLKSVWHFPTIFFGISLNKQNHWKLGHAHCPSLTFWFESYGEHLFTAFNAPLNHTVSQFSILLKCT